MNSLPVEQKENMLLMPNVANEVKADVFNVVRSSIAQCYAHLNATVPSEADLNYLINEVTDSIIKSYPTLRLQEIPIAFSNGIRKKYGEYFGLCVISFEQFITGYLNSNERMELVKDASKLIEVKTEPTDEEKAKTAWNNLVRAWLIFKRDGHYNDHGNSVFNMLYINGKINYSKEEYADFTRIAKADLVKEYNPLQHIGNPIKANEFKAIVNEITNGGNENTRVKVAAKKIALNHFFKELAKMDMEINDLFAE